MIARERGRYGIIYKRERERERQVDRGETEKKRVIEREDCRDRRAVDDYVGTVLFRVYRYISWYPNTKITTLVLVLLRGVWLRITAIARVMCAKGLSACARGLWGCENTSRAQSSSPTSASPKRKLFGTDEITLRGPCDFFFPECDRFYNGLIIYSP